MSTIAVSGSIAQRPGRAGHAWVFLSYLLGLRALGHEVLFVDQLRAEMVEGGPPRDGWSSSREARWLAGLMEEFGLGDSYALLLDDGSQTIGLSRRQLLRRLQDSSLLLNFNGFLGDEELLGAAAQRVYLDIDPGFAQMWEELGLATIIEGHDRFVTVGANVGQPECGVPTGGRQWIATRQPVLLDRWPAVGPGEAFTSIGSWRGPFEPVAYGGKTYGLRVHELRRLLDLPRRVGARFELALDIDPADDRDLARLREAGWDVVDPLAALGDLAAYRDYIQGSMAEISVAKAMYVETNGGWFSDRSASYLASGRPVLAQDTGFARTLPTGEGLLAFSDLDQAVVAAEAICAEWERHSRAARAIAEEYFDAGKVLAELLAELGEG
jgi:hypothetical protein